MSLKYDSPRKYRKDKNKWKNKVGSWEEYEQKENDMLAEKLKKEEPTIKGTIRIIAGTAKGVQIEIPRGTRPVTDRVKTTIFDLLREDIANRTVLDLYAGSGSFGLEALSRGASKAMFVDATRHAEKALLANIRATGYLTEADVVRSKVEDYLPLAISGGEEYEVVFMDPPYKLFNTKDLGKMANILDQVKKLLPGTRDWDTRLYKGVIIIKHPRAYPIGELQVDGLRLHETLDFGRNSVSFMAVERS